MNKSKFVIFGLLLVDVLLFVWLLVHGKTIALLSPKGAIALQERSLILTAIFLMLLVVIPVVILAFYVAWRYREGNTKAKYTPDWDRNRLLEIGRYAVPGVIVFILAVLAWNTTHELDPFKPIDAPNKPLAIQVVALDWKWLFIYPEQQIATVNFIQFPVNTPINFELTADAPMNSFWIPQLGGQMYAMAGMSTQLHLIADKAGEYRGSAVEINGKGFSGMTFVAKAGSQNDFDAWVASVKHSSQTLNMDAYNKLAKSSVDVPPAFYSSVEYNLYNKIIMKFMAPPVTGLKQVMPGMQQGNYE